MGKEINSVLTKLRKTYSEAIPDVKVAGSIKRVVMSSPQLNYIFGGGFPVGRIAEFHGPESGGKTVLACYVGSQFQQRSDSDQRMVVYVDMEHTFDEKYARTVGLDLSDNMFVFVRPLHGEEGFNIVEDLVRTGEVGLLIWDSIASTPSAARMEAEAGKATFGGTARVFAEGLQKINPYLSRYNSSMITINQLRAKIGGMPSYGPQDQTTGGYAPKFYASWRGRVSRVEDILDKKEIIGNSIKIKNLKSKVGFPKRTAQMNLLYSSGFNPDMEYIDFIKKLDIVSTKGAGWMSNDSWGFKGQGDSSLLSFLLEHPDIFSTVKDQVNSTFTGFSALDASETEDVGQEVAEMEAMDED